MSLRQIRELEPTEDALTISEAAKAHGEPTRTMRKRIDRGTLGSFLAIDEATGKPIRMIPKDELTRWQQGIRRKPIIQSEETGWIYTIHAPAVNRAKIGFTRHDPTQRYKAIAAASPTPLILYSYWPGTMQDESDHQREWAEYQCHDVGGTEWFAAPDELLAWAAAQSITSINTATRNTEQ